MITWSYNSREGDDWAKLKCSSVWHDDDWSHSYLWFSWSGTSKMVHSHRWLAAHAEWHLGNHLGVSQPENAILWLLQWYCIPSRLSRNIIHTFMNILIHSENILLSNMWQTLCMHGREDTNMNTTVSKINTDRGPVGSGKRIGICHYREPGLVWGLNWNE